MAEGILSFLDTPILVDLGNGKQAGWTRDANGTIHVLTGTLPSQTNKQGAGPGPSGGSAWYDKFGLQSLKGWAPLLIVVGIVFFAVGGLSRK